MEFKLLKMFNNSSLMLNLEKIFLQLSLTFKLQLLILKPPSQTVELVN
jgi:hypothetical protein